MVREQEELTNRETLAMLVANQADGKIVSIFNLLFIQGFCDYEFIIRGPVMKLSLKYFCLSLNSIKYLEGRSVQEKCAADWWWRRN